MPSSKIRTLSDLKKLQMWMKKSIETPLHAQAKSLKKQTAYYLTGNSRMSAKERFDIYVNDFWPRILDSLSEDFPKLKKIWGEKQFRKWVEKYIKKYPSSSFTLFHLGENLHKFLKKYYYKKNRTKVLETTAFEWAQLKAFMAPQGEVLNPPMLSRTQKENLAHLKIKLHASVSLLSYQKKYWIIYRLQNKVYEEILKPNFYFLLDAISKKQNLSQAINAFSKKLNIKEKNKILTELPGWFTIAVSKEWVILKNN